MHTPQHPAHAQPVLSIKDIEYCHPKGEGSLPIFSKLEFSLERGELLCLAGVNGSGKSTLLFIVAGLYACTGGRYFLNGVDIVADNARRENALNHVAFLMQDANMQLFGSTVEEDVLLGLPDHGETKEEAFELLERFGLGNCLQVSPHNLSYGQKRKLCIAAALLRHPDVLLLDEPFSGLDYPGIKELRSILQAYKTAGVSIILSTHDIDPILSFTDKALVLCKEHGALFGTLDEVFPGVERYGIRPPIKRDFP